MNESTPDNDTRKRLEKAVATILSDPTGFEMEPDELFELLDFTLDDMDLGKGWLLVSAAQRLFPDNPDLKPRIAYLLFQGGDEATAKSLLKSIGNESLWSSTMQLILDNGIDEKAIDRQMRQLVANSRKISPDVARNIVTICRMSKCTELVKELQNDIYAKCVAPTDFMLDLIDMTKSIGDDQWRRSILDTLEQDSPFCPDLWEEKALLESENGLFDEAMSTVEYSLAIEPDSEQGLEIKANILANIITQLCKNGGRHLLGPIVGSYTALVEKIAALYPDNFEVLGTMTSLFIDFNNSDTNLSGLPWKLLPDYLIHHPSDRKAMDLMLHLSERFPDEIDRKMFLDAYYISNEDSGDNNENDWYDWSQWCRSLEMNAGAIDVLETFYRLSGRDFFSAEVPDAYLEMLYLSKNYKQITALLPKAGSNGTSAEEDNTTANMWYESVYTRLTPIGQYIIVLAAVRSKQRQLAQFACSLFSFHFLIRCTHRTTVDTIVNSHVSLLIRGLSSLLGGKRLMQKEVDHYDIFI